MTGYTKLFGSIVLSTIWREPNHIRIVWITMLALANKNGIVEGSVPGLADLCRVSVDECREALEKLQSPDPDSRSKERGGRRIEPIDGGWLLVNHAKYRAKLNQDERREYLRIKKQESRSKNVNKCRELSTPSTQPEAAPAPDPEASPLKKKEPFRVPTLQEVKLLMAKAGLPESEAEKFWNFYESNGWRVGKNPMRRLAGAIGYWKSNYETYRSINRKGPDRNEGTYYNATETAAGIERRLARDRQIVAGKMARPGAVAPPDPKPE